MHPASRLCGETRSGVALRSSAWTQCYSGEALAVYLGMKALDEAQAESSLTEDDAMVLAYVELRAQRSDLDAAE